MQLKLFPLIFLTLVASANLARSQFTVHSSQADQYAFSDAVVWYGPSDSEQRHWIDAISPQHVQSHASSPYMGAVSAGAEAYSDVWHSPTVITTVEWGDGQVAGGSDGSYQYGEGVGNGYAFTNTEFTSTHDLEIAWYVEAYGGNFGGSSFTLTRDQPDGSVETMTGSLTSSYYMPGVAEVWVTDFDGSSSMIGVLPLGTNGMFYVTASGVAGRSLGFQTFCGEWTNPTYNTDTTLTSIGNDLPDGWYSEFMVTPIPPSSDDDQSSSDDDSSSDDEPPANDDSSNDPPGTGGPAGPSGP